MRPEQQENTPTDATFNINGSAAPRLKRTADTDGADFFPTPTWATKVFVDSERFYGSIWEPACGNGTMATVLRSRYSQVQASDLYDRGYGEIGIDFLQTTRAADNIVTDPPFNSAEGFLADALDIATHKVAFLLRLAFVESARRQTEIFHKTPPQRVWIYSERLTFYNGTEVNEDNGSTAYAWFVWDKSAPAGHPEMRWLPLGYKPRKRPGKA